MESKKNDSSESVEKGGVGSKANLVSTTHRDPKNSPFLKRQLEHPTSDNDTLIHLAKGSLGTGVLAMPYAFSNAGLALGIPATLIVGFVCAYCVHMIVKCAHELCWRHDIAALDFGTITEVAFTKGPKNIRNFSTLARFLIKMFLVVNTFGACSIYLLFVSENFALVINEYLVDKLDIKVVIPIVALGLLCLAMVRNLRYLSPLSLISNGLVLASIVIIFIYVFDGLPSVNDRPSFVSVLRFPAFFSTAVFALEGIPVVMPLENSMKTPEHFLGRFRVLNTAMTMIVCIYTLVGFFGFLKYGYDIEGSISLNLPSDEGLAQAAQIMLGIAIAFTYPLQFYCGMDFTWPTVSAFVDKKIPKLSGMIGEYIYRVLLVLLTMCVAIGIPNLGALMGLIGAVCLSSVGIMFPAILETIVFWNNLGVGRWRLWKNALIVIFGLIGFITGAYTSILDIIESF